MFDIKLLIEDRNPDASDADELAAADRLAQALGDKRSFRFYRRVCKDVRAGKLPLRDVQEALMHATTMGRDIAKPGAYFATMLKERLAPVATEIDMWKYLHHGGANADLRLRPGDVIFVPTSPIVGIAQILSALSGLAYFSTIFLPCGSVLGCNR